jgi:Zn-dependent protease/CBS domain-containing protein
MAWSFPLLKVAGSEIRIHVTFFLLLAWIGIAHYQQGGSEAALDGVAFICAVFACVVLHELGHALAARRYGIATPRITLLPIGGLAELERMPERPSEEIFVAVAGPLVNVIIAGLILAWLSLSGAGAQLPAIEDTQAAFLPRLGFVNVALVVFNLIPAFPMDGGRVLRALLATRWPRVRATQIAARFGQAVAIAFAFLGLVSGNVILLFIAIFVYMAAGAEAEQTLMSDIARSVQLEHAMITRFESLGPGATLGDAAQALLRTTQHEFPVVDNAGRLEGILTRGDLIDARATHGDGYLASLAMRRDIPSFAARDRLDTAMEAMRNSRAPAVAVTDRDGRLLGYVNAENIGELVMLRRPA